MKTRFEILEFVLSIDDANEWLRNEQDGGVSLFVGNIRSVNKGKEVVRIDFEAYTEMVYSELEKIAQSLSIKYRIHSVLLFHRVGSVYPGESAVIAGVSAPHRKDAFEACIELMDELKRVVPIWKKEVYSDGHTWISATP
ncbi:MAG: molybdopterin synthase catalytic subunit [Flavobacteriales bacterium]|jgi:molybdopterin synthase catalytic subunit